MLATARATAAAFLGYQIGGMLGGGSAPVILTLLQAAAGSAVAGVPPCMIGADLITIVAIFFATPHRRPAVSRREQRLVNFDLAHHVVDRRLGNILPAWNRASCQSCDDCPI